ncbi:cell wall hydrolase [Sphingomonas daechungensis]|uniref:cell wall hydrolase n=1 Tax=Sphingomonas daechungensis TaxID=1176646 RepID=UPI003783E63B
MTQTIALQAARFLRERPYEVVMAGAVALAGVIALAGSAGSTPSLSGLPSASDPKALPAPPPLLVRQLPVEQAEAINQGIAIDTGPNPAAKAFSLGSADSAARGRALECLTSAVYYEAGQESPDGQRAVAQVVLNRVRHPAFPANVCGVVYEGSTRATGCQFTFTCDGSLMRGPELGAWNRAKAVAEAALNGYVYKPVGNATHYHANYVVPYWAPTLTKNAIVGAHIFYRWAGGWGRPAAFVQAYARSEPNVGALRSAAILAEQRDIATRGQAGDIGKAIAEIPGAETIKLAPSMRGDKRVAVRFNLTARKASDEVKHKEYVEEVKASDNLRWSLNGGMAAVDDKPLGVASATAGSASGSPQ